MKIRVVMVCLFLIANMLSHSTPVHAGAQQYLSPHFEQLTASHKTVAILPFKVTIDTKRLKDITMEQITRQENDEGTEFQRQIYARFLQKSGDLHYRIDFQDVDRTDALLIKAGYSPDSLAGHTMDEIAKVLGVDALVSGTVSQSQPTSQGMAMAQSLLLGFHGSTQRVDIHIDLHNGVDGALLWNYDHTDSGGGFTGSMTNAVEAMTKSLFKKVAGNFPYQQKR